jgi:hypothetical protein
LRDVPRGHGPRAWDRFPRDVLSLVGIDDLDLPVNPLARKERELDELFLNLGEGRGIARVLDLHEVGVVDGLRDHLHVLRKHLLLVRIENDVDVGKRLGVVLGRVLFVCRVEIAVHQFLVHGEGRGRERAKGHD